MSTDRQPARARPDRPAGEPEDPFQRYLASPGDQSATTPQPALLSEKQAVSIRHTKGLVADEEQGANPHEYSDVADVADSDAEWGDGAAFDESEVERIDRLYFDAIPGEPS